MSHRRFYSPSLSSVSQEKEDCGIPRNYASPGFIHGLGPEVSPGSFRA